MTNVVEEDVVSIATKKAKQGIAPEIEEVVIQKDVGSCSLKDDGANDIEELSDSDSDSEDWNTFYELPDEQRASTFASMIEKLKMINLPPENQLFQLCSVVVGINHDVKQGDLYGYIKMYDEEGEMIFFERDKNNTIPICHNDSLPLCGPFNRCLSAKGMVSLLVFLCLKIGEDKVLVVADDIFRWNVTGDGMGEHCRCKTAKGKDGYASIYYVSLMWAVQARVEAALDLNSGDALDVYGTVVAYYDNHEFLYDCEGESKHRFHVVLFEKSKEKAALLKSGKIQLLTDVVAVPADVSLVIEAQLFTLRDEKTILGGSIAFPAKNKSRSCNCIRGEGFSSLDWQVVWHGPNHQVVDL